MDHLSCNTILLRFSNLHKYSISIYLLSTEKKQKAKKNNSLEKNRKKSTSWLIAFLINISNQTSITLWVFIQKTFFRARLFFVCFIHCRLGEKVKIIFMPKVYTELKKLICFSSCEAELWERGER